MCQYPKAAIMASSVDAFADEIRRSPAFARVPVVTAELGNSWNYGAPADPIKVGRGRSALCCYRPTLVSLSRSLA